MIEVKNLTKRFGTHLALDDVSFQVEDGEIVGFLGPNGAGKTTTMNIMTGYSSATSGSVIINGFDILDQPEKAKEQMGYLPDNPPLYNDMKVDEYLAFVARLKRVNKNQAPAMIRDIKEAVRITDMSKRLLKNLSKGYRQRVGIAQAMIGNPAVIILDEPTVGLDPKQIIEVRDVIKKLGKKHTILLSSHILSEVSAVCDRVIIINKGKIVASDTPERLSSALTHGNKMTARIKGNEAGIKKLFADHPMIKYVKPIGSREAGTVDFVFSGDENIDIREAIFATLAKSEYALLVLKPLDLTLEEVFLQITAGEGGLKQ